MQRNDKALIIDIVRGSAAYEAGIEKGDKLISINDKHVKDILDYRFLISDEEIVLAIEKPSGEEWEVEIEKGIDEDPGLVFEKPLIDSPKVCKNKCIFCFMDQLAPSMRGTLHFKDDDYRLSFLEGNYITLTNTDYGELERIIRYRLSPINISVHTTNAELRKKMLRNPNADNINDYLKQLSEAGLEMNCQIVLCRGINDGKELDKTCEDLSKLHPGIKSISIVPVGLTKYRQGLYVLEGFDRQSSREVISQIKGLQSKFKKELGTRLVFLADEFYINADLDMPPYSYYEDFAQLENGVGMVALLKYQFNKALKRLKYDLQLKKTVSIVTGVSSKKYVQELIERLKERYKGLEVYLYPVENEFFGSQITVTGLITGGDIINQLKGKELGDELLIPSVMLKDGEDIFLDDVTLNQLSNDLKVCTKKVNNNGRDFIKAILDT